MTSGLISVLCPTRGRAAGLLESIGSLITQATRPELTEYLLAFDPDDAAGYSAVTRVLGRVPQVKVWTAPERYGYRQIHRYYNTLSAQAAGEWQFLWNDDAQMLTCGWDEVIRSEEPGVLWPGCDHIPDLNTFPIWPAAWSARIGHVSLDQSTDMWWHDLGTRTSTLRRIPVTICHEPPDGDQTTADKTAVANVNTFHLPEMMVAREADAAAIRELIR